jgi:hypothetical protein
MATADLIRAVLTTATAPLRSLHFRQAISAKNCGVAYPNGFSLYRALQEEPYGRFDAIAVPFLLLTSR